jgi:ubiquinone/menaquinone biosynthesis C-methylase UbiE
MQHLSEAVAEHSRDASSRVSHPAVGAPEYYLSPTIKAINECSVYSLRPEEKYLVTKYYHPGDRIADLACGMGRTTLCLHEMGHPIVGMDISNELIQIARRRFPCLDLRVGSFTSIPEPDMSFTHVLISGNGIDLAYPESERMATLLESARVLKPGGTLIFSSLNIKSFHLFSPCVWRWPMWKLKNTAKAFRPTAHIEDKEMSGIWSAPEEVIRQTESAGFKFLEMIGIGLAKHPLRLRFRSLYIHYAFRRI